MERKNTCGCVCCGSTDLKNWEECAKNGHCLFYEIRKCAWEENMGCTACLENDGMYLTYCGNDVLRDTLINGDGTPEEVVDNMNLLWLLMLKSEKEYCPECLLIMNDYDPDTFEWQY